MVIAYCKTTRTAGNKLTTATIRTEMRKAVTHHYPPPDPPPVVPAFKASGGWMKRFLL